MAIAELLPLHDLIAKCNRCGFCQAGCPVFRVTGEEHSLSRGRMAIARGLMLGNLDLTPEVMHALEDCLLCRGCTAHCFPALKTDEMVTTIRHAYITRHGQPMWQRILFRTILSDSKKIGVGRPHGVVGQAPRAGDLAEKSGPPEPRGQATGGRQPSGAPVDRRSLSCAESVPRGRRPRRRSIGSATSSPAGSASSFPRWSRPRCASWRGTAAPSPCSNNTCCGRPAHAYGDLDAARDIAREERGSPAPRPWSWTPSSRSAGAAAPT